MPSPHYLSVPDSMDSTTDSATTLRAVFWDMDGTLVDTDPYWLTIHEQLVTEHGGTWTAEFGRQLTGQALDHTAHLLQQAGVDLPTSEIISTELDYVVSRSLESMPWRPGARELLAQVRQHNIPSAMVTMSYLPLAEAVMNLCPPDTFEFVVTGDMVTHGKPHPEPYQTALRVMSQRVPDLTAQQVVVVEDSVPGVTSALAANLTVAAVPHVAPLGSLLDDPRAHHWPTLQGRTVAHLARLIAG